MPTTSRWCATTAPASARWILDPFAFFQAVLDPGLRPVPDVTTLSGRRIFFSTISGEGWTTTAPAERLDDAPSPRRRHRARPVPRPLSRTSRRRSRSSPATSIPRSAAGFAAQGAALAKAAFTPAGGRARLRSRTLPSRWSFFESYRRDQELAIVDRLGRAARPTDRSLVSEAVSTLGRAFAPPDAGAYLGRGGEAPRRYMLEPFDLDAEIGGSLETVAALAPDRKAAPAFAWSGDAQPFEAALAAARAAGAAGVGGGGGVYDATVPTLSNLAPIGIEVGGERQIYAALSGDAAFTNFWSTPSHGFLRLAAHGRGHRVAAAAEALRAVLCRLFGAEPRAAHRGAASARRGANRARSRRSRPRATRRSRRASPPRARSRARPARLADRGAGRPRDRALRPARRLPSSTLARERRGDRRAARGRARSTSGSTRPATAPVVACARGRRRTPAGRWAAAPGFALDNARWSVRERRAATACSLRFGAQGFGPGEMTWRVPAPGPWRIEVADAGSGERIYWDQRRWEPDGLLG